MHYRKEAEDYDREFMKKHDEDLNTTLIFVSSTWCAGVCVLTWTQAGLFSAVTSAFIIDVQSQLQPDPNDETAALLRVLIHKIDNTTFGNDTPTLPQWTGPSHLIVQVQAILYASLTASLFSAFLAMLGKQWLNRYASTDMRGTMIERSQNRQRKLDGIITWYFEHVMESLPLMLQAALLLLGCALSLYLWGINTTIASVVIGVTSLGIILYIFIVGAGTAFESCPYQTPGSHALRHLWTVSKRVTSVVMDASRKTKTIKTIKVNVGYYHPWWSRDKIMPFLKDMVLEIPHALAVDVYHLWKAMVQRLTAFVVSILSLVSWLHGSSSTPEQGVDLQMTTLDLQCISWMLRISLDKGVHLSTLKHLITMFPLAKLDSTLVADCFNTIISCINVSNQNAVILDGLEQLVEVATICFLCTFFYLSAMDPTSNIFEDVRQHHKKIFPYGTDFSGLPLYFLVAELCGLVTQADSFGLPPWGDHGLSTQWSDGRLSAQQLILIVQAVAEAAQVCYQEAQDQSVSHQFLSFTLSILSLDPPPPTSVIADCLSIIAIDLGCDVSNTGTITVENRCVHI